MWSGGGSEMTDGEVVWPHGGMEEGKMTRRVYVSETEGGNVRGRPPVKWRDRLQ